MAQDSDLRFKRQSHPFQGVFLEWWNTKKVFPTYDNIFHVYLMRRLQEFFTMSFWATYV